MRHVIARIDASALAPELIDRVRFGLIIACSAVLLLPVPWLVAVIACTMAWHGLVGWTYGTAFGKTIGGWADAVALRLARPMLKDVRNSRYLWALFGIGVWAPTIFLASWWYQTHVADGFNWWAVLVYHVLNYGPYFAFFSQVATLIHKEGHEPKGLFKPGFGLLNKFFGYFLAPLYGHVPEGYPMGHMRIHHKFDNAPEDVTSTVYYDRRHASRFMIYLFEFALFWTGISIVGHHLAKGKTKEARKMITGMVLFYGLMVVVMAFDPLFGFAYLLLPHLSSIIFLAAINYTWHAFTDPEDPRNTYKNSVTLLEGQYNVYNEDYHVEHHLRPQTHWTEYPINFAKHREDYIRHKAIIFRDTQAFEVFFLIQLGNYDKMVKHFVDLSGTMTDDEKRALLLRRLQPTPYDNKRL